jgi:acyl-homoserine-lactone acylase
MTYSQSSNPSSRHYLDQTRLYSEKKSKPILFDERAILADPNLIVTRVCAPAKSDRCARFVSP